MNVEHEEYIECSTGGVVCIIGGLDSALSIDSAPREQHHMQLQYS